MILSTIINYYEPFNWTQAWSSMMVNVSWNYHRLSSTIMTVWTGLHSMWISGVKIFPTGVHIDEFSVSGLKQLLQSSLFTLKWGSESFLFNKIQPIACKEFAEQETVVTICRKLERKRKLLCFVTREDRWSLSIIVEGRIKHSHVCFQSYFNINFRRDTAFRNRIYSPWI